MTIVTSGGTKKGALFTALRTLADEIQEEKTAAAKGQTKAGESPTPPDPGGYQGPSTHPTTGVDNSAQTASEGARSSENAADVKADQKSPSVDSTAEATAGQDEQDSVQLNIGTQQSATGEDSSVEDDYKGTKDDPGTSHPATTEDGEKYGGLSFKQAQTESVKLANEILADFANGFGNQLAAPPAQPAIQPPAKTAESADPKSRPETSAPMTPAGGSATGEHVQPGGGSAGKKDDKSKEAGLSPEVLQKAAAAVQASQPAAAGDKDQAVEAGYELATMLGLDKEAARQGVQDCIAATIRDAQLDADLFGSYFTAFRDMRLKQGAMAPDEEGGEEHANPNDASSGANEAGAGGGDTEPPMDPNAPPGGAAPEGAGMTLGDLLGGGAGSEDLGGMPGGMPGGEPSEEEALAELAAALEELGIPIEALAEAAGGGGGGMMPPAEGGGGMMPPAEGGGMPMPGMEAVAAAGAGKRPSLTEGQKLANAVRAYKQSGKYQLKEASTSRTRAIRDVMKGYLREVMGWT
ncbi:MAG: hypothetical protein ACYS7M_04010 [Planctomycetota bacterium]|jgi:hypothetical protein